MAASSSASPAETAAQALFSEMNSQLRDLRGEVLKLKATNRQQCLVLEGMDMHANSLVRRFELESQAILASMEEDETPPPGEPAASSGTPVLAATSKSGPTPPPGPPPHQDRGDQDLVDLFTQMKGKFNKGNKGKGWGKSGKQKQKKAGPYIPAQQMMAELRTMQAELASFNAMNTV